MKIWEMPLHASAYRLLAWLNEKSDERGEYKGAWKSEASKELGYSLMGMIRAAKSLREEGLISYHDHNKSVRVLKKGRA